MYARDIYNALGPEAKKIFDESLKSDNELLDFHKTYVDKDFTVKSSNTRIQTYAVANSNTLASLMAELRTLGLPSSVLYSLQAMGASMIAAIADGPLPIGDILLAASIASATIVFAANWDTVSLAWNSIISAFQNAFNVSAKNIFLAFDTGIKEDTNNYIKTNAPNVRVSGKQLTINGTKFFCNTRADHLTEQQKKRSRYYPAVLYGDMVWVAANNPITFDFARLIMSANIWTAGTFATEEKYARGLCGGNNATWHNFHNSSEGYFFHFHYPTYQKFHCWYIY